MVDIDDVLTLTGIRPNDLRFEKNDEGRLHSIIEKWISQAESIIKSYCYDNFEKGAPAAVENVCLRIVMNMINLAIQNRDSPIIKVNDWTIRKIDSEIFTEAEKGDLAPFVKERPSHKSDRVDFLAITGETHYGASKHHHRR